MDRSQDYRDGYRRASRDAVAWLHEQAGEMVDPHARGVLNTAAFGLGKALKARLKEGDNG